MADTEHLRIARLGSQTWNEWRAANSTTVLVPDLSGADLTDINLSHADLRRVNFNHANLTGADLTNSEMQGANFSEAILNNAFLANSIMGFSELGNAHLIDAKADSVDLQEAKLVGADLTRASFISAKLINANLENAILEDANLSSAVLIGAKLINGRLSRARLYQTNLNDADLTGAIVSDVVLTKASLVGTNLTGANLNNANVYGASVWQPNLTRTSQENLVITQVGDPEITVDNLQLAQFIYLLINNENIRDVIDTVTTKVVLILGRFSPPRKAVLDAIRTELRRRNYIPVQYDFSQPASRNNTETVVTLAHMARFIIADLTDPRSIPHELTAIVPTLPSVAVQPLIQADEREYGMYDAFLKMPWVLPIFKYLDLDDILRNIQTKIIEPAEEKVNQMRPMK